MLKCVLSSVTVIHCPGKTAWPVSTTKRLHGPLPAWMKITTYVRMKQEPLVREVKFLQATVMQRVKNLGKLGDKWQSMLIFLKNLISWTCTFSCLEPQLHPYSFKDKISKVLSSSPTEKKKVNIQLIFLSSESNDILKKTELKKIRLAKHFILEKQIPDVATGTRPWKRQKYKPQKYSFNQSQYLSHCTVPICLLI